MSTAPVLTGLREYRVMRPASFTPEQDLHFVVCDFGRSGLGRARRLDRLREDLETRSIIVNCANNARQKGKAPPGGRRGFESLAGFWGLGGVTLPSQSYK
jgi:hypothetical protein